VRREFVKHGLVYGGANLVGSLGTVLLVPIYTRALAPAEYGVIDYVTVVQNLVQVCAGLEITQGIARFYSGASTDSDRQAYASTGLWFMLAAFLVACASLYAASLFGGRFGLGESRALVAWALIAVYTRILFYALQSQARWELRSDLYAAASVVVTLSTVGFVGYLLFIQGAGVVGALAGLSAGYAVACAFCFMALRHTYRFLFDGRKLRQMLRFSAPLTVSSLALFFVNYGDRLILQSTLGFEALGIYGIGARFAALITLVVNGFQLGAAPLIYRNHAEPGTPASLAQLLRLFFCAGLLAVVALAWCAGVLVRTFTSPEYGAASRLVPLLAFAVVMASLYIFVPGLTLRNMTARFAAINIANAAIGLLLIAACVRFWRESGAALAVLASATIGFTLHAIFSQRVYPMPIQWPRIVTGYVVTSLSIALLWTSRENGVSSAAGRAFVAIVAATILVALLSTPEERHAGRRLAGVVVARRWRRA
jgi:O-antigen/teichoic acid export membrane protein